MHKLYDEVTVKATGEKGHIVEMDDDGGTKPVIYLIELVKKPEGASVNDVIFWCEEYEIE